MASLILTLGALENLTLTTGPVRISDFRLESTSRHQKGACSNPPRFVDNFATTTTATLGASTKLLIFVENRGLDATVSQKPEIAFSPCVGVIFFFRSHAAWEHHFSFFQHLCAARYVFFDFLARRASVETSEGSLCNLHVFIQYPQKKIGVTLSESSTRLANVFFSHFQK